MLSLANKLAKISGSNDDESCITGIVESEALMKLKKIKNKEKRSIMCFDVENKIKHLIEGRLEMLRRY